MHPHSGNTVNVFLPSKREYMIICEFINYESGEIKFGFSSRKIIKKNIYS